MPAIIGKKLGMTQLFAGDGSFVATTVIEVEPNLILDIKKEDKHNYSALVIGYSNQRTDLLTKPVLGQFKKVGVDPKRKIMELRRDDFSADLKVKDFLKIEDLFQVGNFIDVQGFTRGHGFTGAIKLWNFACGPKTHGAGYPHRYQGSLESGRGGESAQKVWKGKKMSGRYGNEKVTIANLEILHIDAEKQLLFVKGAVPGRKNKLIKIKTTTRKNKSTNNVFKLLKYEKN